MGENGCGEGGSSNRMWGRASPRWGRSLGAGVDEVLIFKRLAIMKLQGCLSHDPNQNVALSTHLARLYPILGAQ